MFFWEHLVDAFWNNTVNGPEERISSRIHCTDLKAIIRKQLTTKAVHIRVSATWRTVALRLLREIRLFYQLEEHTASF